MVYHVIQFGDDPNPDPELRAKKHVENPPSLKLILNLIFGLIVAKFGLTPPQILLFNISSGFSHMMSGSKVLTHPKCGPSRSRQTF